MSYAVHTTHIVFFIAIFLLNSCTGDSQNTISSRRTDGVASQGSHPSSTQAGTQAGAQAGGQAGAHTGANAGASGSAASAIKHQNGAMLSKDSQTAVVISESTTEITINPGALQVDTTVSIESYKNSDTSYIAKELGLGDGKVETVAVAQVKATTTDTLANPMTIRINIGDAGIGTNLLALFLADPNYFIVCTAEKAMGLKKAWVIAGDSIRVNGNFLEFETKEFGVFEVFKTDEPIPEVKSMSAGSMNAFAEGVVVNSVSTQLLKSSEAITFTGENLHASVKVLLGDIELDNIAESPDSLTVDIPNNVPFGPNELVVMNRYANFKKAVFVLGTKTDAPLIDLAEAEVCKGISYYNGEGIKKVGTKFCGIDDAKRCSEVASGQNCRLEASHALVDPSQVDSNDLVAGYKLAGKTGTADDLASYPNCAEGGKTDCRVLAPYEAIAPTSVQAELIKVGTKVAGIDGQFNYPVKPECDSSTSSQCRIEVGSSDWLAVEQAALTEGVIRKNVTLGGVQGQYPSAAFPLYDGVHLASLTADSANAKFASTAQFEFFDRFGNRYVETGSAHLVPGNIKVSTTIFGVEGQLQPTTPVEGSANDYRWGYSFKTIASGAMKTNCRNLVLVGQSNTEANNVAGNLQQQPTQNPWGDAKYACLNEGWQLLTGSCSPTGGNCIIKDLKTNKLWKTNGLTKSSATEAQNHCETLDFGEFDDWRVPTQKEAMQATINGIASANPDLFRITGGSRVYWTSTIPSTENGSYPANYWNIDMTSGITSKAATSASHHQICVR